MNSDEKKPEEEASPREARQSTELPLPLEVTQHNDIYFHKPLQLAIKDELVVLAITDEEQHLAIMPPRDNNEPHIKPSTAASTQVNLEPSVTVKVVLTPHGQVVTLTCTLVTTLRLLIDQLAQQLKMHARHLQMHPDSMSTQHDPPLPLTVTLSELGGTPNGSLQLKLSSVDEAAHPLRASLSDESRHVISDVITVQIQDEPSAEGAGRLRSATGGMKSTGYRTVNVEIERPANARHLFLGGWKDARTGLVLLNAATQTLKPARKPDGIERFARDTQTVVASHVKLQTQQDMSTQMTRPGVFVSRVDDKLLTPRVYQTAEELLFIQVQMAIVIQKYFRRWLGNRRFKMIKKAYDDRCRWEKEKEEERQRLLELRRAKDMSRRLNPKTKSDFELLYAALEAWRVEELARINATKTGAARKAALAMLVDEEAELIATIERYKIEAAKENKEKDIHALLKKMSAPKSWKYKDGTTTQVDTPYNVRAKELADIYLSLSMNYLTQDERLDVLLTLKHTVKEHDCALTNEIISLIDREADLLMRGIKEENLMGLRKRMSSLFLQYIKTPQFNPAAAKFLKIPQDINDKRVENFYCVTCESYLPQTQFSISSANNKVGKCRKCKALENSAIKRIDFTKFKYLLSRIQQDERLYGDDSRICFLLTDADIHHLFASIWNSQSVISACKDIYSLTFVRWQIDEEWTPWNCVLLTLDEADSHLKITNLQLNYGESFIYKVKQRHAMAKTYFSKLPAIFAHLNRLEVKGDIRLPPLTGLKIT